MMKAMWPAYGLGEAVSVNAGADEVSRPQGDRLGRDLERRRLSAQKKVAQVAQKHTMPRLHLAQQRRRSGVPDERRIAPSGVAGSHVDGSRWGLAAVLSGIILDRGASTRIIAEIESLPSLSVQMVVSQFELTDISVGQAFRGVSRPRRVATLEGSTQNQSRKSLPSAEGRLYPNVALFRVSLNANC